MQQETIDIGLEGNLLTEAFLLLHSCKNCVRKKNLAVCGRLCLSWPTTPRRQLNTMRSSFPSNKLAHECALSEWQQKRQWRPLLLQLKKRGTSAPAGASIPGYLLLVPSALWSREIVLCNLVFEDTTKCSQDSRFLRDEGGREWFGGGKGGEGGNKSCRWA